MQAAVSQQQCSQCSTQHACCPAASAPCSCCCPSRHFQDTTAYTAPGMHPEAMHQQCLSAHTAVPTPASCTGKTAPARRCCLSRRAAASTARLLQWQQERAALFSVAAVFIHATAAGSGADAAAARSSSAAARCTPVTRVTSLG